MFRSISSMVGALPSPSLAGVVGLAPHAGERAGERSHESNLAARPGIGSDGSRSRSDGWRCFGDWARRSTLARAADQRVVALRILGAQPGEDHRLLAG